VREEAASSSPPLPLPGLGLPNQFRQFRGLITSLDTISYP